MTQDQTTELELNDAELEAVAGGTGFINGGGRSEDTGHVGSGGRSPLLGSGG